MNIFQKLSALLLAFVLVFTAVPAFAEGILSSPTITIPAPAATAYDATKCIKISHTLKYGSRGGDVTILQIFLHNNHYLSVNDTGYFGSLTLKAVKTFQQDSASGAIDGIVGVQTRAHIFAVGCSDKTPKLGTITPLTGPTGTVVTITGYNFTPTGNIVHFSIGGISNISSAVIPSTAGGPALQQLSFTVPSSIGPYCKPDQACAMYLQLLNAGTYPIYIENANGISDGASFTITNNATAIPN